MVKVWLVVHFYMEVGRAPGWLKILCNTWIGLIIVLLYFFILNPVPVLGHS